MFGVLRDCVSPMKAVKHYESPQILLDNFDQEIMKYLNEVSFQFHQLQCSTVISESA